MPASSLLRWPQCSIAARRHGEGALERRADRRFVERGSRLLRGKRAAEYYLCNGRCRPRVWGENAPDKSFQLSQMTQARIDGATAMPEAKAQWLRAKG
jgi:hypothetical protein